MICALCKYMQKIPLSVKRASRERCQHVFYSMYTKEQPVVCAVTTGALTVLPASPSVVASTSSSVTRLLVTVMNCAAPLLLYVLEINDLIFAIFARPSIGTACSSSHSSAACGLIRIASFFIIDFVLSFRSLFQELSHGCSSCSVSVRNDSLTSISLAVALTGQLN